MLRRSYRFLGFTESQVKAGKLMFFREDNDWTVERVLSSFGDLRAVYLKSGYGKYSARLGLSFSSTVQSLDVLLSFTLELPRTHSMVLDSSGARAPASRPKRARRVSPQRRVRHDPRLVCGADLHTP